VQIISYDGSKDVGVPLWSHPHPETKEGWRGVSPHKDRQRNSKAHPANPISPRTTQGRRGVSLHEDRQRNSKAHPANPTQDIDKDGEVPVRIRIGNTTPRPIRPILSLNHGSEKHHPAYFVMKNGTHLIVGFNSKVGHCCAADTSMANQGIDPVWLGVWWTRRHDGNEEEETNRVVEQFNMFGLVYHVTFKRENACPNEITWCFCLRCALQIFTLPLRNGLLCQVLDREWLG